MDRNLGSVIPLRGEQDSVARRQQMRSLGVEPPPALPVDSALLKDNQFLGQTERVERPSADQPRYQGHGAKNLERDIERWDAAKTMVDHNAQLRANRIAKEQAAKDTERQQREEVDSAKRTAARAALEAELRTTFMGNPAATEADWEAAKDGLIARHLADKAVAIDRAARRSAAVHYTG